MKLSFLIFCRKTEEYVESFRTFCFFNEVITYQMIYLFEKILYNISDNSNHLSRMD